MTGDPARIELRAREGGSFWALVDADDAELVSRYRWNVRYCGTLQPLLYAESRVRTEDGNRRTIAMHRLITQAPEGMDVDHIDRDGLNNQRANLRVVDHAKNMHWRRPGADTLSEYKGVFASSGSPRWCSSIECYGKREYLGTYDTQEQAARVYDYRARQLFGEFAYLNFPGEALETPPQVRRRGPYKPRRGKGTEEAA